jgi:hypothetical protein
VSAKIRLDSQGRANPMTDDPAIYSDIFPDRPQEERHSIVRRLILTFQDHPPVGEDPTRHCGCGDYGNYEEHLARETLLDLKGMGFEVRPFRSIG